MIYENYKPNATVLLNWTGQIDSIIRFHCSASSLILVTGSLTISLTSTISILFILEVEFSFCDYFRDFTYGKSEYCWRWCRQWSADDHGDKRWWNWCTGSAGSSSCPRLHQSIPCVGLRPRFVRSSSPFYTNAFLPYLSAIWFWMYTNRNTWTNKGEKIWSKSALLTEKLEFNANVLSYLQGKVSCQSFYYLASSSLRKTNRH